MPQLVKKRRSGWAVLAAGALVASIFAVVGASPVAADPLKADGVATWRACLGPAAESNDFTDVAADSVHVESINCLAYYGITEGRTPDTFDPMGNVTRSQMALFLARAADAAGIDLGDESMVGFVDVDANDTERASAINRLVARGIMFGDTTTSFDPPSATHFAPGEPLTRWEMAMFLFAFLDYALDSVLIDQLPDALEGNTDGVGGIEHSDHNGDGIGEAVDDYFRDAVRETPAHVAARIAAIYELGVTTGVNDKVGEDGRFDPNGLVTRAQMASFIMRSLNHTNLRPAGVTAQYVGDETQVSVRDADFLPVVDQRVEVFYTHFEHVAFDSAGECVVHYVGAYEQSAREACQIDRGDVETDDFGNAIIENDRGVNNKLLIQCTTGSGGTGNDEAGTYALDIDEPSSIAVFKSWAWAGDLYDEVDSDTERFEVVPGNASGHKSPAPTHAVVTGGSTNHLKMGSTVEYEIQVSGKNPNASAANEPAYLPASPVPGEQYGFTVIVRTHKQATTLSPVTAADPDADPPTVETWDDWSRYTENFPFDISLDGTEDTRLPGVFVPNSDGKITVRFPVADPVRGGPQRDDRDVQIQIRVQTVGGNELTLVDNTAGTTITSDNAPGKGWQTAITAATTTTPQTLSSKASRVSDNDPHPAAVKVDPEQDLRVLSVTKQAYVSIKVTDQYGDPFTPWTVDANSTRPAQRSNYTVGVNPASDRNTANTGPESGPVARPVRARGKATHNYAYGGPGGDGNTNTPSVETVTITASLINLATDALAASSTSTATVYWAGTGSDVDQRATPRRVYLADTAQRLIAVQEANAGQPMVYEYGEEDRFTAEGRVVSFKQFEELITNAKLLAGDDETNSTIADNATLEWDDYRRHGLQRRPSTDADWRLDNLNCPSTS